MNRTAIALVALVGATSQLTGCGFFDKTIGIIVNERDNYLESQQVEKISVPSDLEADRIADMWEIPEIEEIPAAKYYAAAAPRPVSIVGDANPDLIRIQKLGDRSWMVVQRKPETVWPLVRQFLTFNEVDVESENPQDGLIVTKPMNVHSGGGAGMLHTVIRTQHAEASDDDFLVFRLEQGMRRGSSEVHLKYFNDANQLKYLDWSLPSPQSAVTNEILRQLAQYEVDDVSDEAVSRIGQEVASEPKIELVRDDLGFPSLRFNVDFERTWATVLSALERCPYGIATRERETRLIELDIDSSKLDRTQRETLGDLLLAIDRRAEDEDQEQLVVQLRVKPYEQANSVELQRSDGEELTLELAEHFLVMIQQFAS